MAIKEEEMSVGSSIGKTRTNWIWYGTWCSWPSSKIWNDYDL